MPRPRIPMQLIREILRLSLQLHLSNNEIHRALSVSRGKVQETVRRCVAAGLSWPLPEDDAVLEGLLYPEVPKQTGTRTLPNWETVHAELRRKGVTLRLLWEEYRGQNPDGYCYEQFTRLYREWNSKSELSMRQEHVGGEKLFVDFVGMKVPIVCRFTGEVKFASIFTAVMGASNFCYAEACESEELRHWLGAHVRALRFFGGVPKFVVPDNLKSAVIKASKFEPLLNKSYLRLANHYGFGIMPTRPRKPKDKAKVEKGVQIVENRILAPLRNHTFFSIEELNHEIARLLKASNEEPFQKLSGCRQSWFELVDAPALRALPETEFEFEQWSLSLRVGKDYHIAVEGHFYSVPYKYVGEVVDVRCTDSTVEILHGNSRIASHMRNWAEGKKTTADEHLPASHAVYQGMSPERFIKMARQIGPNTEAVVVEILNSKPQPQLAFDQCWGLLRGLAGKFGKEDLELACQHALNLRTPGYRVVKAILEYGVKTLPTQLSLELSKIQHTNIRGPSSYQ